MLCVENIIVAPLCLRESICSLSISALIGSNPENGSSNMSSRGPCTTVTMNWTFWAIPLLNSSILRPHHSSMPNFSNHLRSRTVASALDRPLSRAK